MENRIYDEVKHVSDHAAETVGEYPISAAGLAFGLGVGVGLLIGVAIGGSSQAHQRGMTERIGRQVLDAMSKALPDSVLSSR